MADSSSNFDYFDQLSSPQSMNPYLSATGLPPSNSPTDSDPYANLSPVSAHSQQWIPHQQQQPPASPQPINIASPFIAPVGKTDLVSPRFDPPKLTLIITYRRITIVIACIILLF
jgi:hypothetical protein